MRTLRWPRNRPSRSHTILHDDANILNRSRTFAYKEGLPQERERKPISYKAGAFFREQHRRAGGAFPEEYCTADNFLARIWREDNLQDTHYVDDGETCSVEHELSMS